MLQFITHLPLLRLPLRCLPLLPLLLLGLWWLQHHRLLLRRLLRWPPCSSVVRHQHLQLLLTVLC